MLRDDFREYFTFLSMIYGFMYGIRYRSNRHRQTTLSNWNTRYIAGTLKPQICIFPVLRIFTQYFDNFSEISSTTLLIEMKILQCRHMVQYLTYILQFISCQYDNYNLFYETLSNMVSLLRFFWIVTPLSVNNIRNVRNLSLN